MNFFRQGIKSILTAVMPRDRILDCGPATAAGIALTFDDGPHPDYTPRLLDELHRFDIKATFFVVGKAVEQHPALMRRIVAEGHTVGSHTYTHSEPKYTSAAKLLDEVHRSLALIEDLTSQRPTLFRPPKGKLSLAKTLGLWKLRQTIVLWNQDPRDFRAALPAGILPWVASYRPTRGDIVLLHDTHPHCIPAIETLAHAVQQYGLGLFATVDEWLSNRRHVVRPVTEELILQTTAAGLVHLPKEEHPE